MHSERLIKILIHPFFIGFLITGIVIALFRPDISKYKTEVVGKINTPGSRKIYYADLDNDHESEEIVVDDTPTILNIMLLKGNQILTQYNLVSDPISNEFLYAGDSDSDGTKELYLLTYRNDSILLSIIDAKAEDPFLISERLIFFNDSVHYDIDVPQGFILGLEDFGEDMGMSFVFAITTGFSQQPRRVFKYNIQYDSLMISPLSGVSINNPVFCDLNSDSIPEILFNTSSPWNYDYYFPYGDHSSWLMVLDKDLKFIFEPIEFRGYPSSLTVSTIQRDSTTDIVAYHAYNGADSISSTLSILDHSGVFKNARIIEQKSRESLSLIVNNQLRDPVLYLLDSENGIITELNSKLEHVRERNTLRVYRSYPLAILDINNDGNKEYIFIGLDHGSFAIFTNRLKFPVVVDLELEDYPQYFSVISHKDGHALYAQFENSGYVLSYDKHPLYYMRFPLLVLFYLALSSLIYYVYRIQKYRAQRHFNTQKKITELQVLSLKNQIDPHITFNVLNAIGAAISRNDDKKLGYEVLVKYSEFLRYAIQNSDKISISLKEELDYVKSYIELEQFRNESFKYQTKIGNNVDLNLRIPRMLIYTFVENSIKHGIRQLKINGNLWIEVTQPDTTCVISIKDNGPGLKDYKGRDRVSTGKGLQIVNELIELFYKLEGLKINYSLHEIYSDTDVVLGTEVKITISGY